MQKLTNKEEEIMHILWKLEKAFVKDVLADIQEDKPHYNTLSTIIRHLEEKGFVSYNAFGKTHQYFPIVDKDAYKERFMTTAIENYFNNSYKNVVSFFAKEEKISVDELKEIIALIEKKNHTPKPSQKEGLKK
ncbi:MAG: BlaI family penicillinase repressor [Psychroserpens sp.]|jgi:BlaI family penicillinase repressor|uniref:BlaI/MecI/CopY family transcriptional regulator n=1 Tax=Psychroserpens sp. TaxID=2020870 RepID=UPI0039E2143F